MARHKAPLYLLGWILAMLLVVGSFGLVEASPLVTESQQPAKKLMSRGIVSPSTTELIVNTIGFGIFALICFCMRVACRLWVLKRWSLDDYIMCLSFAFYCTLMTLINVSAHYSTNLYPQEDAAKIFVDPKEVRNRIIGSKIVIPMEQCMIASTWSVKFCIWHYIMRMNKSTSWEKYLWALFGYLWVSLAVIEICYYGILCKPFSQYWAMPVQNMECATYHKYSIIQMSFNISSDVWLICSPLPLIWTARLTRGRKCILLFLFALGLITILFAILNKVYNFKSPLTTVYQLWYIREASIAICVGNLICSWQLIQKTFKLRSWNNRQAGIEALPDSPNLHLQGVTTAFGKATGVVRRKVRGLYDLTVLQETVIDRGAEKSNNGESTEATEKTSFNNSSTMTSHTAVESALQTPAHSEDGLPNPLSAHPVNMTNMNVEVKQTSKFVQFVQMSREKLKHHYTYSHQSQPTHLMTVNRDGDDAGPALRYRDENDIV